MGLSANDGKTKKQKKKRFHWFTMTFQIEIASLGYTPTFRHVQTMKIGPSPPGASSNSASSSHST